MNPSKMRDSYGKMMYLLMDTESYPIKNDLKISFVKPILTVTNFLIGRELPVNDILSDPLWVVACRSISNDNGMKSKRELTSEMQEKMMAEKMLLKKYVSGMVAICLIINIIIFIIITITITIIIITITITIISITIIITHTYHYHHHTHHQ